MLLRLLSPSPLNRSVVGRRLKPCCQLDAAVKNPPTMQKIQEMWVWFLGWEDPLEEGMATHSSILAWRIPWTEEPSGLRSTGSQRVGHGWAHTHSPTPSPSVSSPPTSPLGLAPSAALEVDQHVQFSTDPVCLFPRFLCVVAVYSLILSGSPPENSKNRVTWRRLHISAHTETSLKCQMIAAFEQILISLWADFKIKPYPKNRVCI